MIAIGEAEYHETHRRFEAAEFYRLEAEDLEMEIERLRGVKR